MLRVFWLDSFKGFRGVGFFWNLSRVLVLYFAVL